MYIFHLDVYLYSCICMFHMQSVFGCMAVIMMYTLYYYNVHVEYIIHSAFGCMPALAVL